MAKNVVVVGAYWGDEGKGKIVDFLSGDVEFVARFNGGDNAGHTITIEGKEYKVHLIPSGVFQGKKVAIGPGVLVNPETLCNEYDYLEEAGFKPKLSIDARANVIMPYHIEIDKAREGSGKGVGSTKKGIGPCMEDAARRTTAIIIDDLVSDALRPRLKKVISLKEDELRKYDILSNGIDEYVEEIAVSYEKFGKKIKGFVTDELTYTLTEASMKGGVLVEGGQGTLLDLMHGTKPYQTSTITTAEAAFATLGLDGRLFKRVLVAKAYPTRVGDGPFPTKIEGELAKQIRDKGNEYGTTTGRPRDVGMPDFVALRYSAHINGLSRDDGWALTLVDVLAGIPFKIAVAYEKDGKRTTFPARLDGWKPVYEEAEGWPEISKDEAKAICSKGYEALPEGVKGYCKRLVGFTGVPLEIVSLGKDRSLTLVKGVRERTLEYLK
ncbi:adenylosuccinate synthetase [Candidatus Woesearchaeota archaeon]|nr:adenylosuccinate synthetase [Candidatus Woesearchaeota archaeon]